MKPKTMDQIEQALKNWGVDGLYHWNVEWLINEAKDNFADGLVRGASIGDNTARNALKERDADMARWQKDRIELTKENTTLINDRNEVFKLWDMHKYKLSIAKSEDNFFGINDPDLWKSKRYWICQNNMPLWCGLQLVPIVAIEQRRATRDEEMEAIRSYPYDTGACRCRDCRYHRLYRKLKP